MAKALTMKDISARVDQLSTDLNGGLQILREEFAKLKSTQAVISDQCEKPDFDTRLNSFQDSINCSLTKLIKEMNAIKEELATTHSKVTKMESLGNANCLIIHGLVPESSYDLYPTILRFLSDKLNIPNLSKSDIYYCYTLRKKTSPATRQNNKQNPAPVVVQFVTRWARNMVFFKKKLLKGSKFLITEFLTVNTLSLFKKARKSFKNSAWTLNGVVYVSAACGKKVIKSERDLSDLITI